MRWEAGTALQWSPTLSFLHQPLRKPQSPGHSAADMRPRYPNCVPARPVDPSHTFSPRRPQLPTCPSWLLPGPGQPSVAISVSRSLCHTHTHRVDIGQFSQLCPLEDTAPSFRASPEGAIVHRLLIFRWCNQLAGPELSFLPHQETLHMA